MSLEENRIREEEADKEQSRSVKEAEAEALAERARRDARKSRGCGAW